MARSSLHPSGKEVATATESAGELVGESGDVAGDFRARLLAWYDLSARKLPWRVPATHIADPYQVWLSEIMLQQTTVAAVMAYYKVFTVRWSTVAALAAAPEADVMAAWAGLGYYSRARNLHRCAKIVTKEFHGRFPEDEAGLRALPGIGAYTAAAIASIAFDRPATVIDGNVKRVVARWFGIDTPLPRGDAPIKAAADLLSAGRTDRPGDFAQAMMDLGATTCTPRSPVCNRCPVAEGCRARAEGRQNELPIKAPRRVRPRRFGDVYLIRDRDGRLLLERRPPSGLLGGMAGLPTSDWTEDGRGAPPGWLDVASIRPTSYLASHVFTHFALELRICEAAVGPVSVNPAHWCAITALPQAGLPTVFAKCVRHLLDEDARSLVGLRK